MFTCCFCSEQFSKRFAFWVLLGKRISPSVINKLLQITYSWKGEASWKCITSLSFKNIFQKINFSPIRQRLNQVRVGGQWSDNGGFRLGSCCPEEWRAVRSVHFHFFVGWGAEDRRLHWCCRLKSSPCGEGFCNLMLPLIIFLIEKVFQKKKYIFLNMQLRLLLLFFS